MTRIVIRLPSKPKNAIKMRTKAENTTSTSLKGSLDKKKVFKLASLRFLSNTYQEINVGMKEKNSINFVIKLNEDDWMFERSVTTRDKRKSFKL